MTILISEVRVHKWITWFFLWGLLGCSSTPLSVRDKPRKFSADDYFEVYERWTRSADTYAIDRLQDVLKVTATYYSPEFRRAYMARYAYDHGLVESERKRVLTESLQEAQETHHFFVTVASHHWRDSNLTDLRPSWNILLGEKRGRRWLEPVKIDRVRKLTAWERTYFPSVSTQRMAFRVSFPQRLESGDVFLGSDANTLVLRLTGPEGRVDLKWELKTL